MLHRSRQSQGLAVAPREVPEGGPAAFDIFAGACAACSTIRRVLRRSFAGQFTQVLDILQKVLDIKKVKYLVLTGSTPVDVRQTLVDEFTEDESIPVFLLSTKAGGMGINLTAASVVIM